jgi:hypothetical protein
MKNEKRTEYLTRAGLMKLLSDDEAARVSMAETAARLGDGEEYVDLAGFRRVCSEHAAPRR